MAGQQTATTALELARRRRRTWHYKLWDFMQTRPLGGTGLVILFIAIIIAAFAPLVAPYDPHAVSARDQLLAPSLQHFFGTDILGRDVFSRVMFGTLVSVVRVGLPAMLISTAVGTFLGISSAYYGGKYDLILQRFVDVLSAFPSLVLAIAIMAALGQSLNNVVIAITVVLVYRIIRTVRSQALSVKANMYMDAAKAVGVGDFRIMLRYMLPNTFAAFVVVSTASLGSVIEASLQLPGRWNPFQRNLLGLDAQHRHRPVLCNFPLDRYLPRPGSDHSGLRNQCLGGRSEGCPGPTATGSSVDRSIGLSAYLNCRVALCRVLSHIMEPIRPSA